MSSWNEGDPSWDPQSPQDPQNPDQFAPPSYPQTPQDNQQYGAPPYPQNPQQFGAPQNPQQYGAPQYPQAGNWPGAGPAYGYQGARQSQGTNRLAIAGFVCPFFCSLVGFVLSIIGHNQCKQRNQAGSGLALAGIIISGLSFVLAIAVLSSR